MEKINYQMEEFEYKDELKRVRRARALANRLCENFELLKNRPVTKNDVNCFFQGFLELYNVVSDSESFYSRIHHVVSNLQFESDLKFTDEDISAVSSLISQIH